MAKRAQRFWCLFVSVFAFCVPDLLAEDQPRWLTLPPTPTLPKPESSGLVPINGVKIWHAVYGWNENKGEPVMLLHGGLANSAYWGNQIPFLAAHHKVIVMDSRGHGRSSFDGKKITYHLMASDVQGLMDFLKVPQAA